MNDNFGHLYMNNYHQVRNILLNEIILNNSLVVPENKHLFDTINDSLFVLCIDETYRPSDNTTAKKDVRTLMGLNFLHGGGSKYNTANRWFDKTLQVGKQNIILLVSLYI